MGNEFSFGRLFWRNVRVRLYILAAVVCFGLLAMAGRKLYMAIRYREVLAVVESIGIDCVTSGRPIQPARSCEDLMAGTDEPVRRARVLRVRYVSPADQREHFALLNPLAGRGVAAIGLRPGDSLPILAHVSDADGVRFEPKFRGGYPPGIKVAGASR